MNPAATCHEILCCVALFVLRISLQQSLKQVFQRNSLSKKAGLHFKHKRFYALPVVKILSPSRQEQMVSITSIKG